MRYITAAFIAWILLRKRLSVYAGMVTQTNATTTDANAATGHQAAINQGNANYP